MRYRRSNGKKRPPILTAFELDILNWIHLHTQAPWLLAAMRFITDKRNFIAPLLLLAAGIAWSQKKAGVIFLATVAVTIALNDVFCHHVVKNLTARPRPCHLLEAWQHLSNCNSSFSFPSNHAANSAAGGVLFSLRFKKAVYFAAPFVLLVGASRVILGVHFPSDVLAGFLIGGGSGWLGFKCYSKLAPPAAQPS